MTYFIVINYCCSYCAFYTTQVVSRTSESTPSVTTGLRDVPTSSRDSGSVSSLTFGDDSTRSNTLGDINESSGEHIVTNAGIGPDTTINPPNIDNGCREDNATHQCLDTPAGQGTPQRDQFVITVINNVQLAMTGIGFFANGAAYLTLTCNSEHLSPLILLIIKHQSLVDMVACGMGTLYQVLPATNWSIGSRIADFVVCYVWHSQGLFWVFVSVSIWNLVLIGIERYVMICKPFLYASVTKKHCRYAFGGLYFGCFVSMIPGYLQMHFVDDHCVAEHYFRGEFSRHFYTGYSFFIIMAFYILPVAAFVFLYGYVIQFLSILLK